MVFRFIFVVAMAVSICTNSFSQNVGIGTPTPNSNAALEISSANKGLLIPRIALTATGNPAPLSGHVAGIFVYNTATSGVAPGNVVPGFYANDGTKWINISAPAVWGLNGNSGNTTSNFIGTNDFVPLFIKVNGQKSGEIGIQNRNTAYGFGALANSTGGTTNSSNTAIGWQAMLGNINGNQNTAIGTSALFYNDGVGNTATGYSALNNNLLGAYNTGNGWFSLNSNQGGIWNTAMGASALRFNKTGSNNVAIGNNAMRFDSTGNENTAVGVQALYSTNGEENTAVGYQALYNNTESDNTAIGFQSLFTNTSGHEVVAVGYQSLFSNTTGYFNTASGSYALNANTTGYGNTAHGTGALYLNVSGNANTAVGDSANLQSTGNGNTALGHQAGANLTAGDNNIFIGYNAQAPSNTGSNQVRIGDANITYAGIQVPWTITSDSRWKSDIQSSELGLDFINQLHPVSYLRHNDNSQKEEFGFIAQEVEKALQTSGATNTGIIVKDDNGMYSMRYNDLMAPMVKAIQEQQQKIDKQSLEIEALKELVKKLVEKK